jgi:hypothetical protein
MSVSCCCQQLSCTAKELGQGTTVFMLLRQTVCHPLLLTAGRRSRTARGGGVVGLLCIMQLHIMWYVLFTMCKQEGKQRQLLPFQAVL